MIELGTSAWLSVGLLVALLTWVLVHYMPAQREADRREVEAERQSRTEQLGHLRSASAELFRMQAATTFSSIVADVGTKNLGGARADGYTPPDAPRPRLARTPCAWCNGVDLGASGRTCANCGAPRGAEPEVYVREGARPTLNPGTRLGPIAHPPDHVFRIEPGTIEVLPPGWQVDFGRRST